MERRSDRQWAIRLKHTRLSTLIDRYGVEITPTKRGGEKEKSKLKVLNASKLSTMALARISSMDIVAYRKERIKAVGPATVIKEMNLLSHIFNVAKTEWGLVGLVNPVQGVMRPRQPKGRERRLFSADEMERILRETRSPALRTIIPLAVETAMRRSEMVKIKLGDVDFGNQTVHLHETKNGKSRTVPLSLKARAILSELVPEKDGKLYKVKPGSVTRAFIRAVRRARQTYIDECINSGQAISQSFLVDLRLHDMRHEATSRLFEDKNLSEVEVMSITGHGDSRQLRRYTQLRAQIIAQKLG